MTTDAKPTTQTQELRSIFTTGLPEIFAQLNISLVVSTYQAGKVILVRHDGGTPIVPGSISPVSQHSIHALSACRAILVCNYVTRRTLKGDS
jgi:hypothetical protein